MSELTTCQQENESCDYRKLKAENAALKAELAAAQVTIEQMREAMGKGISYSKSQFFGVMQPQADTVLLPLQQALHRLSDTNQDALHEALAKECERLADAVGDQGIDDWLREEAAAYRTKKVSK